jgi:uracil phosphoribosyltransferase
METIIHVHHPLIEHSLTIIRDKNCQTDMFRRHASVVSQIVLLEATKSMTLRQTSIMTPLTPMMGSKLTDSIVLVPVLRAGLNVFASQECFLKLQLGSWD